MLSLSSEDYFLEEVDSHIQANLEDEVVQEALGKGLDLREYSQQVEEDAGRADSLSVRINDRTDDISNQMNGTNDSFDQSIEDVEGNEKNTSPVCENSVNMREIASDDGLDASDLAFATDIATVSERSANE